MQYWTNNKPTRTGYWWAKYKELTFIYRIIRDSEVESYLLVDTCDDFVPLYHIMFKDCQWGDRPISEPIGEKL